MEQASAYRGVTIALLIAASVTAAAKGEREIGRDQLRADLRQVADILESAHPEPYFRGGGKIAFHRSLQRMLSSIPADGMTRRDFARYVAPFVAGVGDGHTSLHIPYSRKSAGGGVPLEFAVVEHSLYVTGVPKSGHRDLLGALLVSVEGIPTSELGHRVAVLRGVDNEYAALLHLSDGEYLSSKEHLGDLLPEWRDKTKLRIELRLPSGATTEREFALPLRIQAPLIRSPRSRVSIPSTAKAEFAFGFMDDANRIAFLRIDGMVAYREAYELNGTDYARDTVRDAYRRFNGTAAPSDVSEAIAGIPSATETFKSLVTEMKVARTEALIVDVRENQGGVSLMTDMLAWFLFGKDEYLRVKSATATDVVKLSPKYFSERPGTSLASVNQGRQFALRADDYDLRYDCANDPEKLASIHVPDLVDQALSHMPTFYKEYKSGEFAGYYCPEKIVVLCDAKTFSGGYGLMWWLYQFGATIVGTPSSQAGNAFVDVLTFQLRNTRLTGQVSTKYQERFPGDPQRGRVLRPHHELTYAYLANTQFDPNAIVLLALERLPDVPPHDTRPFTRRR